MFVVDEDAGANKVIRRIDAITGIITTVAGGGGTTPGTGPATDMDLGPAYALAVDDAGTLFVGSGNQVFKVDLGTGQLSPFAGAAVSGFSGDGGPALDARFFTIFGLSRGARRRADHLRYAKRAHPLHRARFDQSVGRQRADRILPAVGQCASPAILSSPTTRTYRSST